MKKLGLFLDRYLFKAVILLMLLALPLFTIGDAYGLEWMFGVGGFSILASMVAAIIHGVRSQSGAAKIYLAAMVFFLVGLLLRRLHMPGAGSMLVVTLAVPIVLFLFQGIALPFRVKQNRFLVIVGIFASLTLMAGYWAIMSKIQHWPGANLIFTNGIMVYLLLTVFIMVGVQITDFVKWEPVHRTFLTNNILMPWAFIFVVGGTLVLFPDFYYQIMGGSGTAWGSLSEYALPE